MTEETEVGIPIDETAPRVKLADSDKNYKLDSKRIIFIPFLPLMEFFGTASVIYSGCMTVYNIAYGTEKHYELDEIIFYMLELAYFIETILFVMHHVLTEERALHEYLPKPWLFIMLDMMSLIPLELFYSTLVIDKSGQSTHMFYILRMRIFMRGYRIPMYFIEKTYSAGIDTTVITFIAHFIMLCVLNHIIGALWYIVSCNNCGDRNWKKTTYNLPNFDRNDEFHWFLLSFFIITDALSHNLRNQFMPETKVERIIISCTILIGFILHTMVLFGRLITAFIKKERKQFYVVKHIQQVDKYLESWDVDTDLRRQTIDYYNALWTNRYGLYAAPSFINNLPITLVKEITTDIFWNALCHSHLFANEDLSLKRAISLKMRSEFLLPGNYIYKHNMVKTKMIYIVSGAVQIFTNEDGESPVLSFSGGTCIGEMSLLHRFTSTAVCKCVTYCEIQTLDMQSLFRVLADYPGKFKNFHAVMQQRLKMAHEAQLLTKTVHQAKNESIFITILHKEPSCVWLKQRWRQLFKMEGNLPEQKDSIAAIHKLSHPDHISNNLDTLVLSATVELKMKFVFITTKFPFIFEPHSNFLKVWHMLIVFNVLLCCFIYPYYATFVRKLPLMAWQFNRVSDLFFFLDVYIQCSTAIKYKGIMITQFYYILLQRCKQFTFLTDVVGTVPFNYVSLYAHDISEHIEALMTCTRLFRIISIFCYILSQEKRIDLNTNRIRQYKYTLIVVITMWWISCIVYKMACFNPKCVPHSWYDMAMTKNDTNQPLTSLSPLYSAIYYTSSTYIGLGDILSPQLMQDIMFVSIIIVIVYYVYSYCFSEMCATFILNNAMRTRYQHLVCDINEFLKKHKMETMLRNRVLRFLAHQWLENEAITVTTNKHVLHDCPDDLRNKVLFQRIVGCLRQVQLFQGVSDTMMQRLATHTKIYVLPAKATLIMGGVRSISLYYIYKGYCSMQSELASDCDKPYSVLRPGDFFPIIEVLHDIPTMTTVHSMTICHILSLEFSDVQQLFSETPIFMSVIDRVLFVHRQEFRHIFSGMQKCVQLQPAEIRYKPVENMFTYRYVEDSEISKPQNKKYIANDWGWKYLWDGTIDPEGSFLFWWEIFRCIFATVSALMFPTFSGVLTTYEKLYMLRYILDFTCLLDIYVRMHVRYYNDMGVIVSHPSWTAKHYLSHAFIVDLIGMFPFDLLQIDDLFGPEYRQLVSCILFTISRCMQLYRVIGFINHYQSHIHVPMATYQLMKIVIVNGVIINAVSHLLLVFECYMKNLSMRSSCSTAFQKHDMHYFFLSFYFLISIYTKSSVYILPVSAEYHLINALMLYIIMNALRIYLYSTIISVYIGGNVNLINYQEQTRSFLMFAEKELISEALTHTTIKHYEYIWQRTKGNNMTLAFSKSHMALHADIVYFLYNPCLRMVPTFQSADIKFIRVLGTMLREVYIRKGETIIRTNDVQDNVYFVYSGKVEVRIGEHIIIKTLSRGAMFGCLCATKKMRHTMSMIALQHVDLLAVNAMKFFKFIKKTPLVNVRMEKALLFNFEFIESIEPETSVTAGNSFEDVDNDDVGGFANDINDSKLNQNKFFQLRKWSAKTTEVSVSEDKQWYQWYLMVVGIALPFITVIIISLHVGLLVHSNLLMYMLYTIDVFYLSKIVFGFLTMYLEEGTGMLVKDLPSVSRRYVGAVSKFWLDLCSLLPLETIGLTFLTFTDPRIYYFRLNRLLRLIYLVQYFRRSKKKLAVSLLLRWTSILLWIVLLLHTTTCVWIRVVCPNFQCHYMSDNNTKLQTEDFYDAMVLSYMQITNIFTGTGLTLIHPYTTSELVGVSVISLFFQFNIIYLTSNLANLLVVSSYTLVEYEYQISNLRHYLEDRMLSPSIVNKVWKYSLQLWKRQRGEWMPKFITQAPEYLRQDLMEELYGEHLRNNFLFADTHMHFLRQLVTRVKRCVFFPGNFIVEKGDVDQCMYFIHRGEVEVVERDGNEIYVLKVLKANQQFGFSQGLHGIPHPDSIRARTVVDLLILNRENWKDLFEAFPASKETILQRSHDAGLDFTYSEQRKG